MLKWVVKVEICWKSTHFLNKLKSLWCKMCPNTSLDLKFEFLGQFWYSKLVLSSSFWYKTSYLACTVFLKKTAIFPSFLSKSHTLSHISHIECININWNCVIGGPNICGLHIRTKSDQSHLWSYYPRGACCAKLFRSEPCGSDTSLSSNNYEKRLSKSLKIRVAERLAARWMVVVSVRWLLEINSMQKCTEWWIQTICSVHSVN